MEARRKGDNIFSFGKKRIVDPVKLSFRNDEEMKRFSK